MNVMVLLIAAVLALVFTGGIVVVLVLLLSRRKTAQTGICCTGCGISLRPDWKLCPRCGKPRDEQ